MEFATNARDEALKRMVNGLSSLIATAGTIKHEEENFQRFSEHMIHVRELLRKLQSQQPTVPHQEFAPSSIGSLLLRMETEVNKAWEAIDWYKSKNRLFRPLVSRSVLSKLSQSSKEIDAVLLLLPFTHINTALNIKATAGAISHGLESMELNLVADSNAILSILDMYISENNKNHPHCSNCLFMISRSKGSASSSVSPMPILIEAHEVVREPEGESESEKPRKDSGGMETTSRLLSTSIDDISSPPSSFFFCPLTSELLVDPVSVSCDHSFERTAIEDYFHAGNNLCPLCGKELSSTGKLKLAPNSTLRDSILEWKKRNDQINEERKAKKKFIDASAKITPDNMENTNRALGDLHALMMQMPSCISEATESSCELVPKLAELLKSSSANISAVLGCLLFVARFSDENKEIIGRRGVIKYLSKQCMTEPNAIAVLLELSKNKAVAGKIGGNTYSIPILVTLLDNPSSVVAEMARTVLENLSDINSIVMMAKSGYFTLFLQQFNSQEISEDTRALMADELALMQLTETAARNFENEQFISHLTEMLCSDLPSSKLASLNCIKQFMAFNGPRACFLRNEYAIPALLCLITGKAVEELKQEALGILLSLIESTQPLEYQNNPFFQTLFSSNSIQGMLEQIKTSAPDDQVSLLRLLLVMVQKSDASRQWIISDHNAMNSLFSAINVDQNSKVKVNALKLIYYIAGDHPIGIPLPLSPFKESIVRSIIASLTKSRINEELDEELSAAAGIVSLLPPSDNSINEMLHSSAVLKSIHGLITHTSKSNLLLENALGALLRCINQSSSGFQKQVSKLLRTNLVQILSSGSPLAKQRVAMILTHLSRCTVDSSLASSSSLSSVLTRHIVGMIKSVREGDTCPVHRSGCSLQRVFCLVADKAVKPLVLMVKTMENGASEAALMSLDSLFDTGCDFNGAAAAIVESEGATPFLQVLERGALPVKKRSLELLCKICEHPVVTVEELDRFRGLLLNIVRKEDGLRISSETLLKYLV